MAAKFDIFAHGESEPLDDWGKLDIDTPFAIDIRNTGTTTLTDIEVGIDINDAELFASVDTLAPNEVSEATIIWSGDEGERSGNIKKDAVSVG